MLYATRPTKLKYKYTYIVTVYQAATSIWTLLWCLLTRTDQYIEYKLESDDRFIDFAHRLAIVGFEDPKNEDHWIMPGAILEIERKHNNHV